MNFLMQLLSVITNFLVESGQTEFYSRGLAYIGVGICCLAPACSCLAEGYTAAKAVEAIGRQPEASSKITMTMVVGQAITETGALYGFIMAIMLVNK